MVVRFDASWKYSPVFLPLTCQPGSHKGASAPHPFYWGCFPCFVSWWVFWHFWLRMSWQKCFISLCLSWVPISGAGGGRVAKTGFCFTLCCCLALPTTVSLHCIQVKLSMSVLPNDFELVYLIAASGRLKWSLAISDSQKVHPIC